MFENYYLRIQSAAFASCIETYMCRYVLHGKLFSILSRKNERKQGIEIHRWHTVFLNLCIHRFVFNYKSSEHVNV